MKFYKINFSYPDGHVEELEDLFRSLEAAVDYGNSLLNQVRATEITHGGSTHDPNNAFFAVYEYDGNNHAVVYRSL